MRRFTFYEALRKRRLQECSKEDSKTEFAQGTICEIDSTSGESSCACCQFAGCNSFGEFRLSALEAFSSCAACSERNTSLTFNAGAFFVLGIAFAGRRLSKRRELALTQFCAVSRARVLPTRLQGCLLWPKQIECALRNCAAVILVGTRRKALDAEFAGRIDKRFRQSQSMLGKRPAHKRNKARSLQKRTRQKARSSNFAQFSIQFECKF